MRRLFPAIIQRKGHALDRIETNLGDKLQVLIQASLGTQRPGVVLLNFEGQQNHLGSGRDGSRIHTLADNLLQVKGPFKVCVYVA